MDVLDAIYQRRSVSKVSADPLPRELIEKLLGAAVQAPNHYKVLPWRFFVLTGDARLRLGDAMAESLRMRKPETPLETLDAERARPLRAPVLIAVAADLPRLEKLTEIENVSAVAAAIENLLLAAHALGLGAIWRTGPASRDEVVKRFLGLAPEQHIVGFVYIGYPITSPEPNERPSFEANTMWMES